MLNIIVDTREKKNFFLFKSYEDVETTRKPLKTGDYSLIGYENKITIDRKETTGELQLCFGGSWKRFRREIERMSAFEEAYILCSFPYDFLTMFPENSQIPKRRWKYLRTNGSFLKWRYKSIEEEFPNIKFIFSESNQEAENTAYNILREFYDKANT